LALDPLIIGKSLWILFFVLWKYKNFILGAETLPVKVYM